MKKQVVTIFLMGCILALGFGLCRAEGVAKKSTWEWAADVFHATYEEPDVMENSGWMYGITGAYTYTFPSAFMLKTEGALSAGIVDYESQSTGTSDNEDNFMFEIRELIGLNVNCAPDKEFTSSLSCIPFTGIGYRYLNNDSSGKITSTGHAGYERESNYVYSPVGIMIDKALGKVTEGDDTRWHIGATVEYDIFWWGRQISHLNDVNKNYSDVKNTQDAGYGVRGSIKVGKKAGKYDFFVEPFIRYWNIKKSKESNIYYAGTIWGYGYEPKNNTTEIGLKVGMSF